MRTTTRIAGAATALALTAACSQLPERIETLDQARSAVTELEQDPLTRDVAPSRFETAQEALSRAEQAFEESEELELIEHEAYIALRNAQIAQQQIEERRAREELEQGEAERNRVLLQAREREAELSGQLAAERGEQLQTQSERLEEQSELLEQQTQEAQQSQQRAQELEQQTQQLEQQTQQLEQQLAELEAQETERGWVLTLEDVLFDFDAAELNPGAGSTMDRIADFLSAHPDRNIVIEGHTDSTGPAQYNRELSAQRANAVREALAQRGVDASRIEITALGEEFPIATNESTAGRQLNRRVELVLSEEDGEFAGEQRTASADPAEEQG